VAVTLVAWNYFFCSTYQKNVQVLELVLELVQVLELVLELVQVLELVLELVQVLELVLVLELELDSNSYYI
jgi:hypothetical protein